MIQYTPPAPLPGVLKLPAGSRVVGSYPGLDLTLRVLVEIPVRPGSRIECDLTAASGTVAIGEGADTHGE